MANQGVNKVILVGNVGSDPEFFKTSSKTDRIKFTVATNESYKDRESKQTKTLTEWHKVVGWGKIAVNAEKLLGKGDQVYIEGKLKTRSWKVGEETKYITEVNIILFTKLKDFKSSQIEKAEEITVSEDDSEDLPF